MGKLFNIDSPFFKFGNMIADVFILSFIWILFSLPIFTIGASTTALFYVTTRRISDKEGYLFKDFFESFKREFGKSTIIFLLIVLVAIVLAININYVDFVLEQISIKKGFFKMFFLAVQIGMGIELVLFSVFVFPVLSRFELSLKELFKNAFFMANKHFPTAILCVIILAFLLYLTFFHIPLLILADIGLYAILSSYLIMRVFKKYRPEMDSDDYDVINDTNSVNKSENKTNK